MGSRKFWGNSGRSHFTRLLLYGLLPVCLACGGKLTDEERKRLHEGMATQDIKRVTEAELQEAALALAVDILDDVKMLDGNFRGNSRVDSLASARGVTVFTLIPDNASLKEIEQKLIEAYLAGTDAGTAGDNLQQVGQDSLLFTHPVFLTQADGSQRFSHAVGIRMANRTVVLSMPQP